MAQHDYIISNQTFPNTRADINNLASAIATNNSGTSAPTTQYAGQFWIDTTTTTWTLYIHDGTDDIQFATIDTSANTVNFTDSALDVVTDTTPQLGGNLDLNSNDITGTGNINITGNATVSGDLTVDTNTLYVDSTNNGVGIGTTSVGSLLDIEGSDSSSVGVGYVLKNNESDATINTIATGTSFSQAGWLTLQDGVILRTGSNTSGGLALTTGADAPIIFGCQNVEKMRIDGSSGQVSIGTNSPTDLLHIKEANGTATSTQLLLNNQNSGSGSAGIGFQVSSDGETTSYAPKGAILFERTAGNGRGAFKFMSDNVSDTNPFSSGDEVMRITADGKLGIGTSSPTDKLHVSTSVASGVSLQATDTGGSTWRILSTDNNASISGGKLAFNNGSYRMVIDSSGQVGIGTTSPSAEIHISKSADAGNAEFIIENSFTTAGSTDETVRIQGRFGGYDASYILTGKEADFTTAGNRSSFMSFWTRGAGTLAEAMRIDSSGSVLLGKTAESTSTNGFQYRGDSDEVAITRTSNPPLIINRLADDGGLVIFRQANTDEGSITISGATVSYNGFTGTHWSRLSDNSKPTILKGTILESLDEMMDWYQVQFDIIDEEGNTINQKESYALGDGESVGDVITYNFEGTDYQATIIQEGDVKHTKSKVSDTVDAKNVYGVFVDWDNDDDTVNDMYVAQTGTFVVRINSAETVSKGDLIQSNGDGTGKVQADDIIRASTVAKVLSTTKIETYEDGSYIVPCSLHC